MTTPDTNSDRWEHGSEFHLPGPWPDLSRPDHPWTAEAVHGGSGRDVLRQVLSHGRAERGWRRLWVPSYLCQEVVASALEPGLVCTSYPDRPGIADPTATDLTKLDLAAGDVVLVVNHFGLRLRPTTDVPAGVDVIEDHTHDPWSGWARTSRATYCIASIRKTLPVPDGGVLWSPVELPLPPQPSTTPQRDRASARKLAGMLLKGLYLAGHPVAKRDFREPAIAGETEIASGAVSGMSATSKALLDAFPAEPWRRARRRNCTFLDELLEGIGWLQMLQPAPQAVDACSFSAILLCDTPARCARARRALLEASIYPAVLWPLEDATLPGITDEDRMFATRMLSIHADGRYQASDLQRVAAAIRATQDHP